LPSNAHAYRLYVVKELAFRRIALLSAKTTILSRFLIPCQALGFCLICSTALRFSSGPAWLLISEPASIGHVFGKAQLLRDNFF
jgi:hypothetical protein